MVVVPVKADAPVRATISREEAHMMIDENDGDEWDDASIPFNNLRPFRLSRFQVFVAPEILIP